MEMSERVFNKRGRVQLDQAGEKTRTRQSEKDETDINRILGKFRKDGFIKHTTLMRPVYGDFSTALEYIEAVNQIQEAQEIFDALPARVRARVENDPGKLIAFVNDPENEEELRELGLLNPIEDREGSPGESENVPSKLPEKEKEKAPAPAQDSSIT